MVVEELLQEAQVVVITGEVAAVFVFNLQVTEEAGESGEPNMLILAPADSTGHL